MLTAHEIYDVLERRRVEVGLSQADASTLILGRKDSSFFQGLRRGSIPSVSRFEAACKALGLEFYFGPPRSDAGAKPPPLPAIPPEKRFKTFSPKIDLPVQCWAKCSIQGMLEDEEHVLDKPMPEGLDDGKAFYARAMGLSMRPEGIDPGDYCLVSPAALWDPGLRVWLKDRQGRAAIKRFIRESGDSWILRGWLPPDKTGRQDPFDDQRAKAGIKEKGVVLAVWRGDPDVKNPPPLIPDPNPPRVPAPPGIVSALDLPQGSSVDDVIQEIGKRLSGSGASVDALREEMAKAMNAQTKSLRAEISRLKSSVDDLPTRTGGPDEDTLTLAFAEDVRAAAGSGEMIFEEAAEHRIAVPRSILPRWVRPSGLICIRAAGDSMAPTLNDGDLVLLDRKRAEPQDKQVFVIYTDDGLVVKRLREDGGGWEMASDNPVYTPRRVGETDRIVGRVAWSGPLRATEARG